MTSYRIFLALAAASLLAVSSGAYSQSLDQLLQAADKGDAKAVAVLLDKGLDPNSVDKIGNTLLMGAAVQGHEELAKLLIDRKADITRRSAAGDTALSLASLKGHLGIVKMLVDRGAEIAQSGWAPLHYAAFEDRATVVRYLLEKGADKNALAPNGYSPLMLAARGGFSDAARELLYADADLNIKGPRGETVLSMAKARKDTNFEALLRRAGAVD